MSLGIITYLQSLIPHIEKDKILEDLRITETELQEITLPAFANAKDFFSSDKFESKENKAIDTKLKGLVKNTGIGRAPTFLDEYYARLTMLSSNIKILTKLINQEIGRDVVTEGVSSKKIMLMRMAERCSYISRYSLDLLNLVYLNEASASGIDSGEISMSKAEMAKANGSIDNLGRLLQVYGIPTTEFEKLANEAPDLILSKGDNQDIESHYSDEELDPFATPLMQGFTGNPIYHVRLFIAEWQTKRYKANQEKKKVLELRLLHLTLIKEKQGTNPSLERQIAYNQSRVANLDRYLTEVERDLEIVS